MHLEAPVGVQDEMEAELVHQGVVAAAQEQKIGQVCRAAGGPVDDVVRVQPGVPGAAWEAAALTVETAEQLAQRTVTVTGDAGVPAGTPSAGSAGVVGLAPVADSAGAPGALISPASASLLASCSVSVATNA